MVKLKLVRKINGAVNPCIGSLYKDDFEFICNTLEPAVKKQYGRIPVGVYDVDFLHSPRFRCHMLRLRNVPERSGILIHSGNYADQSKGCILVGTQPYEGALRLAGSAVGLAYLYKELGLRTSLDGNRDRTGVAVLEIVEEEETPF